MIDRYDHRTRYGRMMAVRAAVACGECALPSLTRLVVHTLAFALSERMDVSPGSLAHYCGVRPRTLRTHLRALDSACGENAAEFIREVVDGKRRTAEWPRALELHGGRYGG
jgi:hypothetical protein